MVVQGGECKPDRKVAYKESVKAEHARRHTVARLENYNSGVVALFDLFLQSSYTILILIEVRIVMFRRIPFERIILKRYPQCERWSLYKDLLKITSYIGPLSYRQSLMGLLSSTRWTQQLHISFAEVFSCKSYVYIISSILPDPSLVPSSYQLFSV